MAGLRLEKKFVSWAIGHCNEWGDTDIFPRPFEYQWFFDQRNLIAETVAGIDLNTYEPRAGLTYLAPKDLLGFRTADQLYPIDQLILLSTVLTFSQEIEKARVEPCFAFSYRIKPTKDFALFNPNSRYGDWVNSHLATLRGNKKAKFVLSTDIADFYQRINHHRIENCLNSVTENPLRRVVLKQLSVHRAKYSFGIPVGNNASRILAELLLTDTDQALLAEGFSYSRYVDDFRFFVESEDQAFRIMAFLAEHLYLTEGLTLSRHKTVIETRKEYFARYEPSDEGAEAEEAAIRELTASIYEAEEPDPKEVAKLAGFNLVVRLESELTKVDPNANRVRVLLFALKSLRDLRVIPLLLEKMRLLLPFMREIAIMVDYLGQTDPKEIQKLRPAFMKLLEGEYSYLPMTRIWVLELFGERFMNPTC